MEADQIHQAGAFSYAHGRIDDAKRKRLLFMKCFTVGHNDISFSFFRTKMYYTLVLW
jgi:hypothetical protein